MTSRPENPARAGVPGRDDGEGTPPPLVIPDPVPAAGEPAATDPDTVPGPAREPVDGPPGDSVDGPVDDAAGAHDGTGIAVTALAGQQWPGILAMFVDDPRGAVERACAAAREQAAALAAALERQQAALRSSWPDDASTEDLRTALQQYRSFCSRIASATP